MTRRQPAGVPSGGQFATKTHAEVAIDLHDPAAAPLPMLRDETVQAVRDAIEGLESRPVESFRNTYQAFPTAAYGAALDSLRRMRSEMAGEPPPPLRSGADAALDEFRSRRTFIPDTRPITEMQADAVARLDTIVNRLDDPMVVECSDADREFPSDAYRTALDNLRAIRDQIRVGVPPEMKPDVARAWNGASVAQMAAYEPPAAPSTHSTSPQSMFRGPQLGAYRQRLLDGLAAREAARKSGSGQRDLSGLPFAD